jgi:thiosulfate reductase cytochrome b subunit
LMSGLQIFNAHPALYWGKQSTFDAPLASTKADEKDETRGVTQIGSKSYDTTGLLGVSTGADGQPTERGFPSWITVPGSQDLANARRWHFFFAWLFVFNGALYLIYSIVSRHLWRDLFPSVWEWRTIPHSIIRHAMLRFPKGEEARHYNILVIVVLLPVMVLAGLTMSPGLDATFPFLLDLFGGRQSARTIHFIIAWLLVLFTIVHVLMVIVSGVLNNMRSMITGRYVLDERKADNAK